MLLAELELAFVHIAILIHTDSMAVLQVLEPLSVIFAAARDFLPEAVATTFKPLAVVNVRVLNAVTLRAQCALPVPLIVQKEAIIGLLARTVVVIARAMSLA